MMRWGNESTCRLSLPKYTHKTYIVIAIIPVNCSLWSLIILNQILRSEEASPAHWHDAARRLWIAKCYCTTLEPPSSQAALAHLGERQTEVNFCPSCTLYKSILEALCSIHRSGNSCFDSLVCMLQRVPFSDCCISMMARLFSFVGGGCGSCWGVFDWVCCRCDPVFMYQCRERRRRDCIAIVVLWISLTSVIWV
jgi:hypothetical protein